MRIIKLFTKERIMDRDGQALYLERWVLLKSPWLCIYIHRFHQPDYDIPHDHPWWFFSLLLRGEYTEERLVPDIQKHGLLKAVQKQRHPGSLIFRKATDIHRVVFEPSMTEIRNAALPVTLFIAGPKTREWGFIEPNATGYRWESSDSYLAWKELCALTQQYKI